MAFDNQQCIDCIDLIDSILVEYQGLKSARKEFMKIIDVVIPEHQVADLNEPLGYRTVPEATQKPQEHGAEITLAKRGDRQEYYHEKLKAALARLHALELAIDDPPAQPPPAPNS